MQDEQQAGQGARGRSPDQPRGAAAGVQGAPSPVLHPMMPANIPNAPNPDPDGAGDGEAGQNQCGAAMESAYQRLLAKHREFLDRYYYENPVPRQKDFNRETPPGREEGPPKKSRRQ